jgi:hypothetical protein
VGGHEVAYVGHPADASAPPADGRAQAPVIRRRSPAASSSAFGSTVSLLRT